MCEARRPSVGGVGVEVELEGRLERSVEGVEALMWCHVREKASLVWKGEWELVDRS